MSDMTNIDGRDIGDPNDVEPEGSAPEEKEPEVLSSNFIKDLHSQLDRLQNEEKALVQEVEEILEKYHKLNDYEERINIIGKKIDQIKELGGEQLKKSLIEHILWKKNNEI